MRVAFFVVKERKMEITPAEKKYKEMPFAFQVADFIFVYCVTPKGEDYSKADAVVLSAATLDDAEEYILPYYIERQYGEGAKVDHLFGKTYSIKAIINVDLIKDDLKLFNKWLDPGGCKEHRRDYCSTITGINPQEPLVMTFNIKYLLDAFTEFKGNVRMYIEDVNKPVLFKQDDKKEIIVVPIRREK